MGPLDLESIEQRHHIGDQQIEIVSPLRCFRLAMATVVVARWEGLFRSAEWMAEEPELEQVTGQPAIVG